MLKFIHSTLCYIFIILIHQLQAQLHYNTSKINKVFMLNHLNDFPFKFLHKIALHTSFQSIFVFTYSKYNTKYIHYVITCLKNIGQPFALSFLFKYLLQSIICLKSFIHHVEFSHASPIFSCTRNFFSIFSYTIRLPSSYTG